MAYIRYLTADEIPESDRVADEDHILQIHGVHSRLMKLHNKLYRELMYSQGPLTRVQREMIAVVVSAQNKCHY